MGPSQCPEWLPPSAPMSNLRNTFIGPRLRQMCIDCGAILRQRLLRYIQKDITLLAHRL
jgi:hypothetical protein